MRIKLLLLLCAGMCFTACKKDEIPSYTLTVTAGEGGVATPAQKVYSEGERATLTATPDEFHVFTGWTGDVTSTANPHTVKMNSDKQVTANFSKLDSDGDGITDDLDTCPDTPSGHDVDDNGCSLFVYADNNGVTIKAYEYAEPGDSGVIDGVTYTVVDESTLRTMVANGDDVTAVVTTKVTNMYELFQGNTTFDQDISNWDVSNVTDMGFMFFKAYAFNQDIGNWDVSNVTSMRGALREAIAFNQDISRWDVSSVTDMVGIFMDARVFNQNIGGWDVSKVTNMDSMFYGAGAFNQDISGWDVSGSTNMNAMFANANAFSQDLSDWDVSGVTNMSFMFFRSRAFNSDISSWNVGNVTNMVAMFRDAGTFNQDLSNWDVQQVVNCSGFAMNTSSWTLPKPDLTNCTP